MPEHVRTSKHLTVTIDHTSVKIIDRSNQVVILSESLARKWKSSEAVWSVVAGKKLQITVGKYELCEIDDVGLHCNSSYYSLLLVVFISLK